MIMIKLLGFYHYQLVVEHMRATVTAAAVAAAACIEVIAIL